MKHQDDNDLCKEAAKAAIRKHQEIISDLEDIVKLNYSQFKIVTLDGQEIKNLQTIEFSLFNIRQKVSSIVANSADIQTCYKQMGVFDK